MQRFLFPGQNTGASAGVRAACVCGSFGFAQEDHFMYI